MAIIKLTNLLSKRISTTIGTIKAGSGNTLSIQTDSVPIPKAIYEELENLRRHGSINYEVLQDPDIRDEIEVAPNFTLTTVSPYIGPPSDGTFDPGQIVLESDEKVADALNDLNVALKNAVIGGDAIGEPTTGDYSDGFFDTWTKDTLVSDAFYDTSVSFLELAPAKAGLLTSQTLVLSGTTLYSAKIPSGLSAAWSALTPGNTITNLIVDGTYTLTTPDASIRFRSGKYSDPSTAGILTHVEDGVDGATYDIGLYGPGTIGIITVSSVLQYNTFWLKSNAYIDYTQTDEGRKLHKLKHTEAGESSETEVYFDDINTVPSFSSALSIAINTKVSKYLSGIEALGFNTTLDVDYEADSGIFRKAYHPTAVGQLSGTGYVSSNDNPISIPDVDDVFTVSKTITLNSANQGSLSPSFSAVITKPNGSNANSSFPLSQPVNTYGIISTTKADDFFDEAKRIVLNSGTTSGTATPFDSTLALVSGNAQQRHSGVLQYPNSSDYPGFTGDQEYQRFIAKVGASTGALTLTGILYTNIAAYNTGNLNVLLHLAVQNLFFDFGKPVGSFNGTGSGDSRANSIGARNDGASSGSILAWSLGTYSTAFNNNEYRLIVIFKNNTYTLSRISEV